MNTKRTRNGSAETRFTLVELMVVVVIMGIMMALFMPMLGNVAAGSRVKSTAKAIATQLNLARQYSQGSGRYVALMLPGSELPGDNEYKFVGYRLAYVTLVNNFEFDEWVENTKWSFAAKGSAIMEADGDAGIMNSDGEYSKTPAEDSATTVTIKEASLGPPLIDPGTASPTTDVLVRAIIFAPSGKPRPVSQTRYVTVGEAEYLGGTWLIKNPGENSPLNPYRSSSNQYTIEVNAFTGGISYWYP